MSDHRVCKLHVAQLLVAVDTPAYTWEPPIADVMARAGACEQLHIENF